MNRVSRVAYYDFLKAQRLRRVSIKIEREIDYIGTEERIKERVFVNGNQVALAVERDDLRIYIILPLGLK